MSDEQHHMIKFSRAITLGNLVQVLMVALAGLGLWFGQDKRISLNERLISMNAERHSEDDAGVDRRLERIEEKIDKLLLERREKI